MERKTLSNNISGLTIPGTVDLAFEAGKSGDSLKKPMYMQDFGREAVSHYGKPVGTIGMGGIYACWDYFREKVRYQGVHQPFFRR